MLHYPVHLLTWASNAHSRTPAYFIHTKEVTPPYSLSMSMTATTQKLIDTYKQHISEKFAIMVMGPIYYLLGVGITRNWGRHSVSLSQHAYINSILERFGLVNAKPLSMPMDPNDQLTTDQCPNTPEEIAQMVRIPYREAVGCLMYAAIATRPDISYAVSTLSQFLENPGPAHWEAAKRVFRYLLATKDLELTLGGSADGLTRYTDADGASQEHRRTISGHVFFVNGGAVSWSSRKQELVTLSTAEAKYVAATHAAKEAIWLRNFITEIYTTTEAPTTLYCDNQAAIAMATNGNYHARTKHIDIRYHFIRYQVE